jgi:hypothetical protein
LNTAVTEIELWHLETRAHRFSQNALVLTEGLDVTCCEERVSALHLLRVLEGVRRLGVSGRQFVETFEKMHGQRPVIFYTNGYKTRLWDDLFYPPRTVAGFYKKATIQSWLLRIRFGQFHQPPSSTK